MNAIQMMVEEHKKIKRMLKVIRVICSQILHGEAVDYDVFYEIVDFVRNYADKHHHNKEEEILFKRMGEELGGDGIGGPIFGMYAEHDLGRLYMMNLVEAVEQVKKGDEDAKLDIIANAISYTHLLHRHIDKEDNAIYKFAERQLSEQSLKEVEIACNAVEDKATEEKIQEKYIHSLEKLEKEYL